MTRITALFLTAFALATSIACGGGSSTPTAPSAPSAPPGPLSAAIVLVLNVSATVEPTATGFLYKNTITLTEASHRSGATIASIRVNLSNATRNGNATFDRNDNIVTALASGGSNVYQLNVTSDNRDPFTQVTFFVTYADGAGVGGSFTSPSGTSITLVPAATTPLPVPNPSPTPPPPGGDTKYDGVYDFSVDAPAGGGTIRTQIIPAFVTIRNGVISARDSTISDGQIDRFNAITFTWVCLSTGSSRADFRGHMLPSALAGSNLGEGTYTCRSGDTIPSGITWRLRQVGR